MLVVRVHFLSQKQWCWNATVGAWGGTPRGTPKGVPAASWLPLPATQPGCAYLACIRIIDPQRGRTSQPVTAVSAQAMTARA
ncbi:MAG TPA: hypothetical protein VH592_26400 [Gemmataceae bacterium]